MSVIAPSESDLPIRKTRPDPVFSVQGSQPGGKGLRLTKEGEISVEAELAVAESLFESVDKLSAKNLTQHLARKKVPLGCGNPVGVIGRQPTRGHHAMYMWVNVEFLTPGVQHAEEADFCTEMFRIARHFEKGFRTGTKQEIVEGLLVLQDQRGQMTGQGEDHLHVRGRKKFPATLFEPTIASARLTLRAVPIST